MSTDIRLVRGSQLAQQISPLLHLSHQSSARDDRLFNGRLFWMRLRDGLSLHCSDCTELNDFNTQAQIRPCLNFVLFLAGNSEVQYGKRRVSLGPRRRNDGGLHNEAAAIALAECEQFSRQARRGARVRKVVVSLAPEWFEAGGLDGLEGYQRVLDFSRQHLALRRWQPSQRLLALAEQMLVEPGHNPMLQRLQMESRSLEIAAEALGVIGQQSGSRHTSLRPHELRRIRRVVELLESSQLEQWNLEDIARDAGINANTLQLQFKAAQGLTIFEYLRQHKLRQARYALEYEEQSIAQAAWLAGYSSAANFATAFKRQFGLTPKQVQPRLRGRS